MVRSRGCGRGNVGCRAHTGFVGEQAAFDAIQHGSGNGACRAAGGLFQAKGTFYDQRQNARDFGNVHGHHAQRQEYVGAGHERHDKLSEANDLAQTAKDDNAGKSRDDHADTQLGRTKGALHGIGNGVGLYGVENQAEGDNQADRENGRGPGRFQAFGNVHRRASPVLALAVANLVQLGQSAFSVTGGHTDEGYHPHPENGTGTAQVQGNRNPGKVTGTHPGGQAGAQGLERRNPVYVAFPGTTDGADHFAEIDELKEAQTDGKEDTDGKQAIDEDIAPEDRVEKINNCSHG